MSEMPLAKEGEVMGDRLDRLLAMTKHGLTLVIDSDRRTHIAVWIDDVYSDTSVDCPSLDEAIAELERLLGEG